MNALKPVLPLAVRTCCLTTVAWLFIAGSACAGDLVYRPINPSFGGDALNSSHLLQLADIQNEHRDDGSDLDSLFEEDNAVDQFINAMQGTMISGSASQLSQAIFQDGAPPSGNFYLNGATVSYETQGDRVLVSVTDGITTDRFDIPRAIQN